MSSGFSFAQHEDDPMDVVKNPGGAAASAIGGGAVRGAGIGAIAGVGHGAVFGGKHPFRAAGTRGALLSAVGMGAGAALGYHGFDKKKDVVERAYGKVDPFELQKVSSDEMAKQAAAYQAGVEFALQQFYGKE